MHNLKHMPNDPKDPKDPKNTDDAKDPKDADPKDTDPKDDQDPKDPVDPKAADPKDPDTKDPDAKKKSDDEARNAQLYKRLKDVEAELKIRKDKEKEDEKNKLIDEGKHNDVIKTLEDEKRVLTEKTAHMEAMVGTIEKLLATQIETIPEERRCLIPEHYTAQEKLDYIAEHKTLLVGQQVKTPPGTPDHPKSDGDVVPGDEEKLNTRFKELLDIRKATGYLNVVEKQEITDITRKLTALADEKT